MFQHSTGTRKPHGIQRTEKSAEIILVFIKSCFKSRQERSQGQKKACSTRSSAIYPKEKRLKL